MIPREELERLAIAYQRCSRDLGDVLGEAYLLGVEAHRDSIGAPSVWRVAVNGELIEKPSYHSTVKRLYPQVSDARRALQFAPEGATVQAGRVEWEDV